LGDYSPPLLRVKTTDIDTDVYWEFQALSDTEVLVEGPNNNETLWLDRAPFGNVPHPARTQIDNSVFTFQALSDTQILVEGADGTLWLERTPFGNVPPPRSQIDSSVLNYQAVPSTNATEITVLGSDFKLWDEFAPF
jgi:hypothetical protein